MVYIYTTEQLVYEHTILYIALSCSMDSWCKASELSTNRDLCGLARPVKSQKSILNSKKNQVIYSEFKNNVDIYSQVVWVFYKYKKPSNQQFQESSYQNRKTVQRIQFSIYRITTVGWSKSQLHLTSCLIYRSEISHYATS